MDLLPKTVISIRNEARSAAYRAALGTASGSAFGFLLGSSEPFEAPAIEFSLVSAIPSSDDELWQAPGLFRSQLPAATRVAEQTGVEVIGLFAAWDTCPDARRHQLLGLWVDTAQELQLEYVVHFSTTAHEPLWAPSSFVVCRFPHTALPHRNTRGKLSIEPRHNPRRVRTLWHQLLHVTNDA